MSTGTYANYADTIEQDLIVETCPDEWAALNKALTDANYDIDQLASSANYGGDIYAEVEEDVEPAQAKAIMDAYVALLMAFSNKTDLGLLIRYHDKEDRGDEVDGVFWEVEGMYIFSPAGEKYKKQVDRKFWTTYG